MKIALICGSPKKKDSTSGALLRDLKGFLGEAVEVSLWQEQIPAEALNKLRQADVWVVACPLYVDGIPSHLLSCLMELEQARWPKRRVYGIVNCGFYEGIQGKTALNILENWCKKAGFTWSGGIGVGCGGGFAQMPKALKTPVKKALSTLAAGILRGEGQKIRYVSLAFPRFLYRLAAQLSWRLMIKANGGRVKDLGKCPEP